MDSPENQALDHDKPRSAEKILLDFFQPAILVALITGLAYVMGYVYDAAYLGRFGLYPSTFDHSPQFYLMNAFRLITLAVLPLALLLYVSNVEWPHTLRYWIGNLIVVAYGLLLIWTTALQPSIGEIGYVFGILCFVIYGLLSFRRRLFFRFSGEPHPSQALKIFILLGILYLFSLSMGEKDATDLVENNMPSVTSIEFKWAQAPPADLVGRELFLVRYQDGKYYVVPFAKPAPNPLKLYIINENQIEYATTKRPR